MQEITVPNSLQRIQKMSLNTKQTILMFITKFFFGVALTMETITDVLYTKMSYGNLLNHRQLLGSCFLKFRCFITKGHRFIESILVDKKK